MPRRIIGQCSASDFRRIEEIVDTYTAEQFQGVIKGFSKTETIALNIINQFRESGIPYKYLRTVREVLIWGEGDKVIGAEFKFFNKPEFKEEIVEIKRKLTL